MNVVVTFGGTSDHSKTIYDANFMQWSGNVYQGTLVYSLKNCVTGEVRMIPCDVTTGGYHMSEELKQLILFLEKKRTFGLSSPG
jgi:hypothetical protein